MADNVIKNQTVYICQKAQKLYLVRMISNENKRQLMANRNNWEQTKNRGALIPGIRYITKSKQATGVRLDWRRFNSAR